MKGAFFKKPLEFKLTVEGETWKQGDPIQGTLLVKNHGTEPIPLDEIRVCLGDADLKKVRAKSPDAFEIKATVKGEPGKLVAAGLEAEIPWTFQLDRNCSITDISGSLFLVYGQGEATEAMGQLQLTVIPAAVIQEFVNRFEIAFRFVLKGHKSRKDGVESKLVPPTAKIFNTLEHVILMSKFKGDTLRLRYAFHIKKTEMTMAATIVKKEKRELEQEFEPAQYLLPSGRYDHERMESALKEAIALVES